VVSGEQKTERKEKKRKKQAFSPLKSPKLQP
jgi:hypothetical protein